MTKPPPTQDNAGLVGEMEHALLEIERVLQATPERSEPGDDLAQQQDQALIEIHEISQKALALARLTHPVDTAANADDGLAGELERLHEAARGSEFDLVPADGPIARLALFMHENGDRICAALRTTRETTDES